ncbi:hypothetical protein FG93_04812 [Bosea sp. LC85]|uniref:hypothetical protein n=1 Tax=Bosea sp. LC85 TaxID=1502851 RepID=UPI0004E336A0|nr:hypothetical protein [Bosea sp. LC85]KFC65271.1 hypothetical protein FG93_04812 [Bosea sp. LC85]
MARSFPVSIETLELGHDDRSEGFYDLVIATDTDGSFFDLQAMTSDGRTVRSQDWRWGMAQEWIAIQAMRKFSQLHEAMIEATSPDARAAAYADFTRARRLEAAE